MMENLWNTMEYYSTRSELIQEQTELVFEKMRMDRFFSMFLDKFGLKMDSDKTNTPVWDLYKKKLKEYTELNTKIKTLEYRISNYV